MAVDWNQADSWHPLARELVGILSRVHKVAGAKRSSQYLKSLHLELGEWGLWEQFDLRPVDAEAAGSLLAETYAEVAAGRWDRYADRPIPDTRKDARVAFFLWITSTDPKYAYSGRDDIRRYCTGEMEKYFSGDAVGPNAIKKYIDNKAFDAGLHPDVERELKGFAHELQGKLLPRLTEKGLAVSLGGVEGPADDMEALFWPLAPASLAEAFARKMAGKLNPMQQWVLRRLKQVVEDRATMLITAPTGTGKSRVGQVALAFAARGAARSAVQVLPLKALVAQELRTWEQLREEAGLSWRIVAASRDFPEFDGLVARGHFDVALAIYESIGAYLAAGARPLSRARLMLVDELQYLAERGERGAKLEMLLTAIRMLPEEQRPAVMGLSATIQPNQSPTMKDWLNVPDTNIAPPCERPVPVDAYVVATLPDEEGQHALLVQRDAHRVGTATPPSDPPERQTHTLAASVTASRKAYAGLQRPEQFAVEVTRQLLKEDATRRIIVFVQSRSTAHHLASVLDRVLEADDPAHPSAGRRRPGNGNPWQDGRFADAHSAERAAPCQEWLEALTSHDRDAQKEVAGWLRGGVAAHTARLLPSLRHQVEQEFSEEHSLLRAVVATDTLAVGLNLPADVVVVSRLTGFVGSHRQQAMQTVAQIDNKTGRAGRLGQGGQDRGRYYLITPTEQDLQGIADPGRHSLTSPEGVLDHYVLAPTRTAEIRSHLRDADDMARLVLTSQPPAPRITAGQPVRPPTTAEFLDSIDTVVSHTLRAAERDLAAEPPDPPLPTAQQVYDVLVRHQMLDRRRDYVQVSRLGLAVARAGLPLAAGQDLERIARRAEQEASDLELLFEGTNSSFVGDTVQWVALREYGPAQIDRAILYAQAYGPRDGADPTISSQGFDYALGIARTSWRPEELLESTTINKSSSLGELCTLPDRHVTPEETDALVRALVAFEWTRGQPFRKIKARMETAVRPDPAAPNTPAERRRRQRDISRASLKLHAADVLQLVEQLSGLLSAAASVIDPDKYPYAKRRLSNLADTVAAGVPLYLVPLAQLRIPTLQRERLLVLAASVDPHDASWENVPDLLDRPQIDVPQKDRHRVRRLYEDRRWGRGHQLRHMLLHPFDTSITDAHETAGGAPEEAEAEGTDNGRPDTFDRWLEELQDGDAAEQRAAWKSLLETLGLQVESAGDGCQQWLSRHRAVRVRIPDGEITGSDLDAVREDLVIAWQGISDRASALAAQGTAGDTQFVEPQQLVARICWVVHLHRAGEYGEQELPEVLMACLRSRADPRMGEPLAEADAAGTRARPS